jgi:hypothetical protein
MIVTACSNYYGEPIEKSHLLFTGTLQECDCFLVTFLGPNWSLFCTIGSLCFDIHEKWCVQAILIWLVEMLFITV